MTTVSTDASDLAVVVLTAARAVPALCYIAPALGSAPPARDYVERIAGAARRHGLPADYVRYIESCADRP